MSFASSLLGGGGGGGSSPTDSSATDLFNQIIAGNKDEETKQKDYTDMLSGLVGIASNQSRQLGIADASRRMAAAGGNKWIQSGSGYTGIAGDSRQLGGQPWNLGG